MSVRRGTRIGVVLLALMCATVFQAMPAAIADPGSVGSRAMEDAVHCDTSDATKQTVLLVHGTGGTADEVWSWNYEKALKADGFGICTVDLPQRALTDIAESVEYTAHAADVAHRQSGRKIAMIGHSQAGLIIAWLMKFYPEVARVTGDAISLAGPMNGTALADALCASGQCAPIAWQLRTNSQLHQAFERRALPADASVTSIGSAFDTVVFPQPESSRLTGARNVTIQDLCPGRPVEHGTLLVDEVTHRLVMDALTHDGPADPARVGGSACAETFMPHLDPGGVGGAGVTLTSLATGLADPATWVSAEPPVPAYAVSPG